VKNGLYLYKHPICSVFLVLPPNTSFLRSIRHHTKVREVHKAILYKDVEMEINILGNKK